MAPPLNYTLLLLILLTLKLVLPLLQPLNVLVQLLILILRQRRGSHNGQFTHADFQQSLSYALRDLPLLLLRSDRSGLLTVSDTVVLGGYMPVKVFHRLLIVITKGTHFKRLDTRRLRQVASMLATMGSCLEKLTLWYCGNTAAILIVIVLDVDLYII